MKPIKIFVITPIAIAFLYVLVGCNRHNRVAKRQRIGNQIVEGDIINDSVYNGTINFYDTNGKLVASKVYLNGIKNGVAKRYFPGESIFDSLEYSFGSPNGFHYEFQSDGRVSYYDYYAHGFNVGPRAYYENGLCRLFYFQDFETHTIYCM